MSLVSRRLDTSSIRGQVHVPKAVGYKKGGGEDPMFVQPPQKATFNLSKSIGKPIPAPPAKPPTNAPLMCLQEGADLKRGLYTPQSVGIPLKVPVFRPVTISHMEDPTEIFVELQAPINYNIGIRPDIRALKHDFVSEPAPPMFRPGRSVKQMDLSQPPSKYRDNYSQQLAEMLRSH